MNAKQISFCSRWPRGMALVELVAGLALLAAVLAGIVTARAQLRHQARETELRRQAIAAVDAMLADWWADVRHFPRQSSGRVDGAAGLVWSTRPVRSPAADSLLGEVVRLEVSDESDPRGRNVLASVEVLLPREARK